MIILPGIAKGFLKPFSMVSPNSRDLFVGNLQLGQAYKSAVKPFSVGLVQGIFLFYLLILYDSFLSGIYQKKFARMNPFLFHDMLFRKRQYADLR